MLLNDDNQMVSMKRNYKAQVFFALLWNGVVLEGAMGWMSAQQRTFAAVSVLSKQRFSQLRHLKNININDGICLFGLLDDFENESSNTDTSTTAAASSNDEGAFQNLFDDLIFATNPASKIKDKLEAYSDSGFVQYLTSLAKESQDEEERQALQELLDMIDKEQAAVMAMSAQKESLSKTEEPTTDIESTEQQPAVATTASNRKMSAAEMLKQANAIDRAVTTSVAAEYDENRPSDFMTDAKAERGLTGFNNKGRMRVGGN